jgi:hypothetical protein
LTPELLNKCVIERRQAAAASGGGGSATTKHSETGGKKLKNLKPTRRGGNRQTAKRFCKLVRTLRTSYNNLLPKSTT